MFWSVNGGCCAVLMPVCKTCHTEIWMAAGYASFGGKLVPGAVAVRMLSAGQKWTLPFLDTIQREVWNGNGPSKTEL